MSTVTSFSWEKVTYKKVGIGILLFAFTTWAMSQFVIFPRMTTYQRASIMVGLHPGISSYLLNLAFISFAVFFVFHYDGRFASHKNRLVVFAMALGAACGLLVGTVLRLTWHF